MSLLEVTVVLVVLMMLTAILSVATRVWRHGAERTACVISIRNVQLSVRTYQNLYGYSAGGMPYAENGTQDIARHLHAKGYISLQQFMAATGKETCAGGGLYSRKHPDVFPPIGQLYLSCTLEESDGHRPAREVDW